MIPFCYFLLFLILLLSYKKRAGWSVGLLILLFYFISAILTFIESFIGSPNADHLNPLATGYYAACVLISLWPFLILGKYDCRSFEISHSVVMCVAYVLIFFGIIETITSIIDIYNNRAVFLTNLVDVRYRFYDRMNEVSTNRTVFYKISRMVHFSQYMSPFYCIYFLSRKEKWMAWLLFFASLSLPIKNMSIGEREASLVFLSNFVFSILFFRPVLSHQTKKKLLRGGVLFLSPFVLFLAAMTFARSSGSGMSSIENLLLYGGDMPYFFSRIFKDNNIVSQAMGGRMCFRYFFPIAERMQNQINDLIVSDYYLNQFGGVAGSFFLDFSYNAIFFIAAFSFVYYLFIKESEKKYGNNRFPYYLLVLFLFSYEVCFMNIFYFDYNELYSFFLTLVLFIFCFFTRRISFK